MTNKVGAYTNYEQIESGTERAHVAQKVFRDALHGFGVGYRPLLFATQVVNGINYKFIALGTIIVPDFPNAVYSVVVNVALDGTLSKPDIKKLDV